MQSLGLIRLGKILAVGLGLTIAAGCATTRSTGEAFSDATVTSKVKAKLAADTQVAAHDLDVDTRNGVVRLSGYVEDEDARREAVQLARDTEGVKDVINDIEVGDIRFGAQLSDAAISTKVKTKLATDSEVDANNIDVDTDKGVVTLFGVVKSEEAKQEALKLARQTEGVKDVQDRLKVEGAEGEGTY